MIALEEDEYRLKNSIPDVGDDAIPDIHGENASAAAVDTSYDDDYMDDDCSNPHLPCEHDTESPRGSREYVNSSLDDWHNEIPVDIPVDDEMELDSEPGLEL